MTDDIRTCSESLLHPGRCCFSICPARATQAVLFAHDDHMVEHTRCDAHVDAGQPDYVAAKPLVWSPTWGPAEEAPQVGEEAVVELPEDMTAAEYRRRARALVQQSVDELHGPRADRLVAQAQVFALCALSARDESS